MDALTFTYAPTPKCAHVEVEQVHLRLGDWISEESMSRCLTCREPLFPDADALTMVRFKEAP